MELTTAAREKFELEAELAKHEENAKKRAAELRASIRERARVLEMSAAGIDFAKVELAKTVIDVGGSYARAGDDRASVLHDAIKQISTVEPIRPRYGDLWRVYFGTKSYDRWHGQRCDCEYGMGPGHGSIIFRVGLRDAVRKREPAVLTAEEIEAAIYYLVNLERVQAAEARAAA